MKLKKVVIVTGGTSGIGFAIAKLYATEGADVVIASHNREKGVELAESISADCLFIKTDVRDEAEVKKLFATVKKKLGKVDVVVNSAGVYSFSQSNIAEMPTDDFDLIMDTNLKGIFLMSKYAIPELLKTRGNIINIASSIGLVPEKESAVYCASKAAVIMFSKALALQFADRGVRVNAICPGPIDTPMLRRAFPTALEYDAYVQLNPMKRAGTSAEVARLAFFIGSDESAYITGGVFSVDGGEALG